MPDFVRLCSCGEPYHQLRSWLSQPGRIGCHSENDSSSFDYCCVGRPGDVTFVAAADSVKVALSWQGQDHTAHLATHDSHTTITIDCASYY